MTKSLLVIRVVLVVLIFVISGASLVTYSNNRQSKTLKGFETYARAMHELEAGNQELEAGNIEAAQAHYEASYKHYLQSALEFEDPQNQAAAYYAAANLGWASNLADFNALVELYKRSLSLKPGFEEASYNLELLYWLSQNQSENLPIPQSGLGPSEGKAPSSGGI